MLNLPVDLLVGPAFVYAVLPANDKLVTEPHPVTIQPRAEQIPLSAVGARWVRGVDSAAHIGAVQRLLDQGATPFVHAGQEDAGRVIDFYGQHMLRPIVDQVGRGGRSLIRWVSGLCGGWRESAHVHLTTAHVHLLTELMST